MKKQVILKSKQAESCVKFVPLGGMREIGKNCYAYQFEDDIIVVDVGIAFPDDEMPGVDVIIPDFSWLRENKSKVRALFLTHGHEDHIGAVKWFLNEFNVPVYGTPMTLKLVELKLRDYQRGGKASSPAALGKKLHVTDYGKPVRAGKFSVEFIHVNHSIADSSALLLDTPAGRILHSGDFKVDFTPVHGEPMDLNRLAILGQEGILALVSESTNVEVPGTTPSESIVGDTLTEIFSTITGRIIVATFASNIYRMQQIITAAEHNKRKVALLGRSMLNAFEAASSLGYLKYDKSTVIEINELAKLPPEETLIISTGSQGESMSALARIAFAEHRLVRISPGDTVILSSSIIPGNEKSIYRVINELYRLGAEVIYEKLADIHVSGHAYADELKLLLNLTKPKYFIPMHGEFRHLYEHAKLGQEQGIPQENIFIMDNGDILEFNQKYAGVSGYTEAAGVLIDGSGIGDVDELVLRDRLKLADDGVIAVHIIIDKKNNRLACDPKITGCGFIYESESQTMYKVCEDRIKRFANKAAGNKQKLAKQFKSGILHNQLRDLLFQHTRRRPVILLTVTEI